MYKIDQFMAIQREDERRCLRFYQLNLINAFYVVAPFRLNIYLYAVNVVAVLAGVFSSGSDVIGASKVYTLSL